MLFTIMGIDTPDSLEGRLKARPEHLARLKQLNIEGRLILAGPHPKNDLVDGEKGFSGSLIVAEFSSLKAAEDWANADPYIEAGVYAEVIIKPFIKALP